MSGLRYLGRGTFANVIALACTTLFFPLAGQADNSPYTAPDKVATDPNGVDLIGLHLTKSIIYMTIGDPGAGGLVVDTQGPRSHSYAGAIVYWGEKNSTTGPGKVFIRQLRVKIGGATESFYTLPGTAVCTSGCPNMNGPGATLVNAGANWIYTTTDGTVYRFDNLAAPAYSTTAVEQFIGKLLSVLKPDGTLVTINYDINSSCSNSSLCYRIKSVISNRGYALRYNYTDGGYSNAGGIDGINLLAHSCDALAQTCDGVDVSQVGIKDALGNQTTITYLNAGNTDPLDNTIVYSLGNYASPEGVTINCIYDGYGRIKTITKPQGVWTYSYSDVDYTQIPLEGIRTITVKGPDNAVAWIAKVGKAGDGYNAMMGSMTDALGRTTNYGHVQYDGVTFTYERLSSITPPEGNYIGNTGEAQFAYDARGNVTTVTKVPKAGSGLSSTSMTASYPTTCIYIKTCNQPTWTKDAKLNQTDYTYDNNHGGVLTVTLPADQNGVRNRTYNTYTAFDTGNGIVYRQTSSETCALAAAQLVLTACPADINTSVSVIDYGTSTTAPSTYKSNLPYMVARRDKRATGYDAQITTYAYDNIGNVVSIDGPLAGTVDQTFTTYDANRRKIFEIGPIPGGSGTQKRSLVRHQYNGDGQETQTAQGYASSNLTTGTDAVFTGYTQMNYDTAGRLIRSQTLVTGNVVP